MLYLTESQVRDLLPMDRAIDLVEAGLRHWAAGRAENHPRRRLQLGSSAMLHYMTALDLETGYLGAKLYTTHPETGAHFFVLLFSAAGRPLASIEANVLGQIRTGAATGVATRCLARPDAGVVGVIGSGFQARTQLEAVARVRSIRQAKVFSRSPENRAGFAKAMEAALNLPVVPVASAREAAEEADIVITATNARDPVLAGEWLEPGMHVNAVGSNHARRRELDAEAVRRADLIVADSVEQARAESGDLIQAFETQGGRWEAVVELRDVVAGTAPGRSRIDQITLFKSNGLALEDIAVAGYLYEQATRRPISAARNPARR
jgi:ornithine cyclodeaminase/alanine dehydrogenase-like protein (mu-crystallin family)